MPVTLFGKELRKIRIDHGERAATMAHLLGISPSYLSAIETGQRVTPHQLSRRVAAAYALDRSEADRLVEIERLSRHEIRIDMCGKSARHHDAADLFVGLLDGLDAQQIGEVIAALEAIREPEARP